MITVGVLAFANAAVRTWAVTDMLAAHDVGTAGPGI
jgi:hypothetical protein